MNDPELARSAVLQCSCSTETVRVFGEKVERDIYIAAVADKYTSGSRRSSRRLVNEYGAKIGMAAGGAPRAVSEGIRETPRLENTAAMRRKKKTV